MPVSFLHGVETVEVERGPRPVRIVKTAVIGLVGTAPIHTVDAAERTIDKPVLVLSDRDARRAFGAAAPGYTIAQAIDAVFDHGAGTIIAINVFDPAVHKTDAPAADRAISGGNVALPHGDITAITVKLATGLGDPLIEGTDYTLDRVTGLVAVLTGGALDGEAEAHIAYSYGNPAAVTAGEVIGGVDGAGLRTGLQALRDAPARFGFRPSILLAPVFCEQAAVATEMDALAHASRAFALIDAPAGITVQQAIEARGPLGVVPGFNTSSERRVLCYPKVTVYDAATDADRLEPLSQRLAGAWVHRIVDHGYWWSPSNTELRGITGMERPITAAINDPSSEANALNEAGVVTVFNNYGSGIRSWGNRSAAWPSDAHPKSFLSVRMTADVVHESLEHAMLPFMDRPITAALIDSIRETGEAFIRVLVGRGALVGGSVTFDSGKNDPTQIAQGHLVFDLSLMPPPPMERLTFESFIDIGLLRAVAAA